MPGHNHPRIAVNIPRSKANSLAGIPQIRGSIGNVYNTFKTFRFFNVARADNYADRTAHQGITRNTVNEQEHAKGEVNYH